ncbi:hypothetical protein ACS6JK_05340 [Enterobacter chuandaensis]|uniref:hypothetical protein n=1 Tax=Enterobacter chuandaensis TaxID=2497875 RepID=UPI00292D047F
MKKILIVTFLLTTTITQAHAISEAYRRQLQKEHKTQLSDIAAPQNVEAYKPGKLKPIHVNKNGIDFKRSADGFAYLDGVLMAKDEDNSDATAYSSGLYTVIVYKKSGKINAIEDGKNIIKLK